MNILKRIKMIFNKKDDLDYMEKNMPIALEALKKSDLAYQQEWESKTEYEERINTTLFGAVHYIEFCKEENEKSDLNEYYYNIYKSLINR